MDTQQPVSFPDSTSSDLSPTPTQIDTSQFRLAGFWRRFLAMFIDGIILFLGMLIPVAPLALLGSSDDSIAGIFSAVFQLTSYVAGPIYMVFFTYKFGATPGKMAMHIRVVTTGEKMTVWKAILREVIGKFLSRFFGDLGFLWNLFDEKRQTWHDKIAHTMVIDTRSVTPEELANWKAKQKSYLPDVLVYSGLPYVFFFFIALFTRQVVYTFLPKANLGPEIMETIGIAFTVTSVVLLLLGVLEIATGIILFDKRRTTPYLPEFTKKVGIGIYIGVQIFFGLFMIGMIIYGVFSVMAHLPKESYSADSYSQFKAIPSIPAFPDEFPSSTTY